MNDIFKVVKCYVYFTAKVDALLYVRIFASAPEKYVKLRLQNDNLQNISAWASKWFLTKRTKSSCLISNVSRGICL